MVPNSRNPGNPAEHTPIQKRILRELQALQDLETLDPTKDEESRAKFLENFDWKDSTLSADEKGKIEELLGDIGIAANDADHIKANLRATFKCIQDAGLKLTMHKCHFGATEINFLGRTITPQGVKPQKQNVQNVLEKTKFPKSKKALQRYLGFLNYYRNYVPRLSERLAPFYKMLKSDEKVLVSKELVQQFVEINKALDKCCDLALQQPIPNKQIALMTEASFGAAGYAVLIEDDPNQKFSSLRKSYAPVAYGSKSFTPAHLKMSIHAKEFVAFYFAFKEFGHIFWGAPKPVIILTDNKAVTRFYQTKIVPAALWNACDYVIQFSFVIAHIPGAQNTAADYLSRLEADPKDKLVMKILEDVQTVPIEINVQSAGMSQEEQIFYTNDDDETEEQYWARKEAIRKKLAIDEPTVATQTLSTNLTKQQHYIQVPLRKTNQIIIEQSKDAVLQQLNAKLLHEDYSKNLLQQDARYRHYANNLERIVIRDKILTRQYFDETRNVKYHRFLLPQHLLQELPQSLHGTAHKHPGISKMLQEIRQRYYYHSMAKHVKKLVEGCEQCAKDRRVLNATITPDLLNLPEWDLGD